MSRSADIHSLSLRPPPALWNITAIGHGLALEELKPYDTSGKGATIRFPSGKPLP